MQNSTVNNAILDAMIIGGSYAGLAAAMALGRSMRTVLLVDSGKPCNRQTPYSHNFLTQDGVPPAEIARLAQAQVLAYDSVTKKAGLVTQVKQEDAHFGVTLETGEQYHAAKILLATGVRDLMPATPGFAACWGISVLHCPYCHGYEVRNKTIGILAAGEAAYELCILIQHWTEDLTLFSDGPCELDAEQRSMLQKLNIRIDERQVRELEHQSGQIKQIQFEDGSPAELDAIFARPGFEQSSRIAENLGCELSESGHIAVSPFQQTSVPGVFAAGDNCSPLRAVAMATAAGTTAGVAINMELLHAALPTA